MNVIDECAADAVHVFDRIHVMKKMNEKINNVRAEESCSLKQQGKEEVLKHSRWCLLKRRENLSEKQAVKMSELLRTNLHCVKAYLMREDFQRFWLYSSPVWAGKFLDQWCTRALRIKTRRIGRKSLPKQVKSGLLLFRA